MNVLVDFLIVGKERSVPDRQSVVEIVLDDGHRGLHIGACDIVGRAACEFGAKGRDDSRSAIQSGNAQFEKCARGIRKMRAARV
jgi:hypothetical protein